MSIVIALNTQKGAQFFAQFICVFSLRYLYMLGKDTWVERWPAESEYTRGSTLKAKCAELKSFPVAQTKNRRQI